MKQDYRQFAINANATLVIGLGGAGGQVVARLKRLVLEHYAAEPQVCELVSYLVIDTDRFDRLEGIPQAVLDPRDNKEFLFLTGFNPREAYRAYLQDSVAMQDLKVWFPPADVDLLRDRTVDDGASRCRPVGRFYLYHRRGDVRARLKTKIHECLSQREGIHVDTGFFRVIVFCSCCGGTGSSAFFDVLYMLQHHLRLEKRITPLFEAFVMAPDTFVREAVKQNRALEPYLRANAYAFFREADYVMKRPDDFNELAMDSSSEQRCAAGVHRNGLPPSMTSPIDTLYVIDEGVAEGGLGNFRTLKDLYDFTARAAFYTQFVPEAYSQIQSRISNTEAMKGLDNQRKRPLRYAALGCSEIRYPGDLLLKLCMLMARRDALLWGIVGESYAGIEQDIRKAVKNLQDEVLNTLASPLQEDLNKILSKALRRLVGIEQFLDGKKVDWEKTTADSLRKAAKAAQDAIDAAKVEMDRKFHEEEQKFCDGFAAVLDSFTNSFAGCNALFFLLGALLELDRLMEKELDGLSKSCSDAGTKAAEAVNEKLGGSETQPPVISEILRRDRKSLSLLSGFLDGLSLRAKWDLEAHRLQLAVEQLRRFCGDVGKDAMPMVYDETSERYIFGTTPVRSILDRRIEQVRRLHAFLTEAGNAEMPDRQMRGHLQILGKSPTTQFIPDLFGDDELRGDLLEPYYREFPGFRIGNDPQKQKKRAEFLKEFLPRINTQIGQVTDEMLESRDWVDSLQKLIEGFIEEKMGPKLRKDLLPLLENEPEKDIVIDRLHRHSSYACRFAWEAYVDQEDRNRVQELHFFGASDEKKAQKMKPATASPFLAMPDRLVEVKIKGIFPFWVCKALRGLETFYYRRGDDNFPHIDHRFNQGELDVRDSFGLTVRNPAQVFLTLFALSRHIQDDPDVLKRIQEVVRFDEKECALLQIPVQFIYQVDKRGAAHYGLNAVTWKAKPGPRGFVLSPVDREAVTFSDPFMTDTDRMEVIRRYRDQEAVLLNHVSLLDEIFERHGVLLAETIRACEKLRGAYEKALHDLRTTPVYKAARTLEHSALASRREYRIALANEQFFVAAVKYLDGVIADYTARISGTAAGVEQV